MELQYRVATIEDIDTLVELRELVLQQIYKKSPAETAAMLQDVRDYFTKAMAEDTCITHLAMDGNTVAGWGSACFYELMPTCNIQGGKYSYLMNIFTREEYRRQGIAEQIVDNLVDSSRKRGCERVALEATSAGRFVYEKYGFKQADNEMEFYLDKWPNKEEF